MMTDKQLYKKTFDTVISSGMKSVEVDEMIKSNRKAGGFKRKAAVAVITICILLGGGVAYAYTNGIFDMLQQKYTDVFKGQEKQMAEEAKSVETEPDEPGEEALKGGDVFENALSYGYLEQVEMYINQLGLHDYRRVKKLSKEELEGAYYNKDYTELTIQGVVYHVMLQCKEFEDEEVLENEPLKVWVFSEENWSDRSRLMAEEAKDSVIEGIVKPIMNGHAAIYNSDENRSFERELTQEECANAQVSLLGTYVKLGEDIYVVTGSGLLDEGEICLLPAQGYQGEILVDEATLNAEPFFSVDEWLEK